MFNLQPTKQQLEDSKNLVSKFNFGNRGYGDGNKKMQEVGILGQICLADLLSLPRPSGDNGFDGGFDFIINNKKVDVKTMGRTVDVKNHYVHNFVGYQLKYDCQYYIFLSYNYKNNKLTICGLVPKKKFEEKSILYKLGDTRVRDDGTTFLTRAPMYEIFQSDLCQIYSVSDIFSLIKF